jgi:hypothetical protein
MPAAKGSAHTPLRQKYTCIYILCETTSQRCISILPILLAHFTPLFVSLNKVEALLYLIGNQDPQRPYLHWAEKEEDKEEEYGLGGLAPNLVSSVMGRF